MAKILIVDDDSAVRGVLRSALESAEHLVAEATGGDAAMQTADGTSFDLVITDIFMPDGDGIDLIRHLRRQDEHLPIVAMTGGGSYFDTSYCDTASALGASATLPKPFSLSAMRKIVDDLLGS